MRYRYCVYSFPSSDSLRFLPIPFGDFFGLLASGYWFLDNSPMAGRQGVVHHHVIFSLGPLRLLSVLCAMDLLIRLLHEINNLLNPVRIFIKVNIRIYTRVFI